MQKRDGLALFSVLAVLAIGGANCSSPAGTNPGTGGEGGDEDTGGTGGATGGSGGSSSGGKGGSTGGSGGSSTGGKGGSTGGSGGSTGGSGGDTGGSGGATGGSGGSTGGSGGSTGGSGGSGGATGGSGGAPDGGAGSGGAGGSVGGPFKIVLMGLDESMKFAGGPVFTPGQSRPMQHSPAMMWSGEPTGTKSFAISMIDTQKAPSKTPPLVAGTSKKVHFVIYNIPSTAHALPANIPNMAMLPDPAGTFASQTFEQRFGWFGPGGSDSVYRVQLWALDVEKLPGLNAGASQAASFGALAAHSIGQPAEFLAAGTNGGFK
jgi:phosphatidylethanolamine-binding protein (PEBP) family uncharacterized protein